VRSLVVPLVGWAVLVAVIEAPTVAVTRGELGVIVGETSLSGVGMEVAVRDVSTETSVGVEVGIGVKAGIGVKVDVGVRVGINVEVGGVDVSRLSAGVPVTGKAVSSTNWTRVDVGGIGVAVDVTCWGVTGIGAVVGTEVIAVGEKNAYRANQARPPQTANHRTMPKAKAATRPAEL